MKSAFTMIELIFVIVIIGILAGVAIPKLVATRDDAKISLELSNLAVYVEDISTYYMATGIVDENHSSVELKCFISEMLDLNGTVKISVANGGDDNEQVYCVKAQENAEAKGLVGDNLITIGGVLIQY